MFPNYCGVNGFVGWLIMLLLWAGLVSLVVWGVARLFPDHSRTPPASGEPRRADPPRAPPDPPTPPMTQAPPMTQVPPVPPVTAGTEGRPPPRAG